MMGAHLRLEEEKKKVLSKNMRLVRGTSLDSLQGSHTLLD